MNTMTVRQRILPRLSLNTQRRDCQQRVLRAPSAAKSAPTVQNLMDGLKNAALIRFVEAVLSEPECQRVLTLPMASSGVFTSPPEQRLRAAAWSTCLYPSGSRMQTDVIYAATLVLGLQNLLKASGDQGGDGVLSNSAVSDVFFTICHPALRRLESQAPVHAALLRVALNWGNVDEMLDEEAQRMQSIVRQASRVCAGRLHLKKRLRFTSNGEVAHG